MSDPLRAIANASGFALQLKVEEIVANSGTPWHVMSREHAWPDGDDPKFADLIVSRGNGDIHLVIECKRMQGDGWVFFVPLDGRPPRPELRFRALNSYDAVVDGQRRTVAQVEEMFVAPASPESSFCAVKGGNDRDRPMLDRICAELVRSVDAVANQQLELDATLRDGGPRQPTLRTVVIPMVVTNVPLHVCLFDPTRVSLEEGTVPDDAVFESVGSVRYIKSFDTRHQKKPAPGDTLRHLQQSTQRSVVIVSAPALLEWLRGFNLGGPGWRS